MTETVKAIELVQDPETKVGRVVEWLIRHPDDVFFGGLIIKSPCNSGVSTETVTIFVAPTKPIYNPEKLNEFMDTLIPDEKRSRTDEFWPLKPDKGKGFDIGKLYFDENIGLSEHTGTTTITAIDEAALQRAGIEPGIKEINTSKEIKRRTWVHVMPHPLCAQVAAEYHQLANAGMVEPNNTIGDLIFKISGDQLEILKKNENPFEEISGLLAVNC